MKMPITLLKRFVLASADLCFLFFLKIGIRMKSLVEPLVEVNLNISLILCTVFTVFPFYGYREFGPSTFFFQAVFAVQLLARSFAGLPKRFMDLFPAKPPAATL